MKHEQESHRHSGSNVPMYRKLAIMTVLSFIAMYALMYAMVDQFDNAIPNINQFYMAGLMTMPMLILELIIMSGMYKRKKLNAVLLAMALIAGISFYICIRRQASVGDREFLKSMIPHHASAVLMVEKASVTDPEIKALANKIISSQQAEIQQMKAKLKVLEGQAHQETNRR
jgi:hypothetical protein